jgi:hypothetical protein
MCGRVRTRSAPFRIGHIACQDRHSPSERWCHRDLRIVAGSDRGARSSGGRGGQEGGSAVNRGCGHCHQGRGHPAANYRSTDRRTGDARGGCRDTRRSNKPCATTTLTLSVSPDSRSLPKLNPVDRRGTDPYARWWGRGGIARCPPIPINLHSSSMSFCAEALRPIAGNSATRA